MKVQKLTIDIDAKGALTIKAEGFEGKKCLSATDTIEKKLGILMERKMTDSGSVARLDNTVEKKLQH